MELLGLGALLQFKVVRKRFSKAARASAAGRGEG